jgi:hypothetical protein
MKIVINPDYEELRSWLETLPSIFENQGITIHQQRNTVKVFSLEKNSLLLNVKRFKQPHIFNRLIYTFFRKSKACRSYLNTQRIAAKGFNTATEIACIEIKHGGLFADSYFVSLQIENVRPLRDLYKGPLKGNELLIEDFALYTFALHKAGIYHLDYSPGNVLFRHADEDTVFYLLDLNRMKFKSVSIKDGCRSFQRMFDDYDILYMISRIYGTKRDLSPRECNRFVNLVMKFKNRYVQHRERKNRRKKL